MVGAHDSSAPSRFPQSQSFQSSAMDSIRNQTISGQIFESVKHVPDASPSSSSSDLAISKFAFANSTMLRNNMSASSRPDLPQAKGGCETVHSNTTMSSAFKEAYRSSSSSVKFSMPGNVTSLNAPFDTATSSPTAPSHRFNTSSRASSDNLTTVTTTTPWVFSHTVITDMTTKASFVVPASALVTDCDGYPRVVSNYTYL